MKVVIAKIGSGGGFNSVEEGVVDTPNDICDVRRVLDEKRIKAMSQD